MYSAGHEDIWLDIYGTAFLPRCMHLSEELCKCSHRWGARCTGFKSNDPIGYLSQHRWALWCSKTLHSPYRSSVVLKKKATWEASRTINIKWFMSYFLEVISHFSYSSTHDTTKCIFPENRLRKNLSLFLRIFILIPKKQIRKVWWLCCSTATAMKVVLLYSYGLFEHQPD